MDLLPSLARLVLTRIGWVFATGDSWDAEILALRHQIFVLQRQVDRPRFNTIWNEHPLRQLVEESNVTQPAPDSSTNTEQQPEPFPGQQTPPRTPDSTHPTTQTTSPNQFQVAGKSTG